MTSVCFFHFVKMKKFYTRFLVVKLALLLLDASMCGSSSVDPRWNTGVLPEVEVKRIMGALKDINYLLFDRSKSEWHPLHRSDPIPESLWHAGGDVKMIIHGYTFKSFQTLFEKLDEQNIWALGAAYANKSSSYNVFIVDWTILSTEPLGRYYEASEATPYVGDDVANFLIRLFNESYITDWDKVHLIGFSLGGHTVGVVGASVQQLAGAKIGRITGLDPAGPNFEDEGKPLENLFRILDKSDGKFVDVILCYFTIVKGWLPQAVIHCNMKRPGKSMLGHLGSCVPSGHADFFPDGGEQQRQFCTRKGDTSLTPCSHMMCTQFMKESITQPRLACPCESWAKFKTGKCDCTLETGVYMGDQCPPTASGQYFVAIKK